MKRLTHAGAMAYKKEEGKFFFLIVSSSDGGNWVLPKGHVEYNEDPQDTVIRELKEETGVLGKVNGVIASQSIRLHGEDSVVQYYLVEAVGNLDPDEHRIVKWVDEQTALHHFSFEDTKEVFKKGIDLLKKKGTHSHGTFRKIE